MLFSETAGRQVVSATEARTVGIVDGFVVDPATASVVALRLKKTDGSGDTLVWEHIHAIGPDAVIVRSGATLGTPSGELAPSPTSTFLCRANASSTNAARLSAPSPTSTSTPTPAPSSPSAPQPATTPANASWASAPTP